MIEKENQVPEEVTLISKEPVFDENKVKVLDLRDKGWAMETIAKELGISYGTVNRICSRKNVTQIY